MVRAGKPHAGPPPYDDPMSFYEPDPDLRVAKWLWAIWPDAVPRCQTTELAQPIGTFASRQAGVLPSAGWRRPALNISDAYAAV